MSREGSECGGGGHARAWRPTPGGQLALAAYWFALSLESAGLLSVVLPHVLAGLAPGRHVQLLANLTAAAAVLAMAVQPSFGAASDRVRARGGRRGPLVLAGAAVNVAGLLWMAVATSRPALAASFLLAVFGENVSLTGYQALLPDVVPVARRGAAAGYRAASSLVGSVAGLAVVAALLRAGSQPLVFVAMALAIAAGAAVTVAGVAEPARPVPVSVPTVPALPAGAPLPARPDGGDFRRTFAARLLVMSGLTLITTFGFFYLQDAVGARDPASGVAVVGGVALLSAALAGLASGSLADRWSRRRLAVLSCGPMAAALAGFALVPRLAWLPGFALLFGLGYGTFSAATWALVVDVLPRPDGSARGLGTFGIAGYLPGLLAPLGGGWILTRYPEPVDGYRALFLVAAGGVALGSAALLGVGARPRPRLLDPPARLALAVLLLAVLRLRYRIHVAPPALSAPASRRRPALVVANHQHDLDSVVVPAWYTLRLPWRRGVYAAASQRLFEAGFLVPRVPVPLRRACADLSLAGLLRAVGALPLENEPHRRALASLAREVAERHGDLPVEAVFTETALDRLRAGGRELGPAARLHAMWLPPDRGGALPAASPLVLREPYRSEVRDAVRGRIEAQLARCAEVVGRGDTLFLTPEGRVSEDGRLGRLHAALARLLAPAGASVHLAAISYDPFRAARLILHCRLLAPPHPVRDLRRVLAAARPVTVSQLLATWLSSRPAGEAFGRQEAIAAARALLLRLPAATACTPELTRRADLGVPAALRAMTRLGYLRRAGGGHALTSKRRDGRLHAARDIFAHQANQFAETCAALTEPDA